MTILEAIQANPVFSDIEENTIKFMLSSRSIDGEAAYSESELESVELVSADLYVNIAMLASFKEGQLSVTYNPKTLKSKALSIYEKYDDEKANEFGARIIDVGITAVNNA